LFAVLAFRQRHQLLDLLLQLRLNPLDVPHDSAL
jgi:hypothetical protein